jgi:ribosomal protein L6P/L9E
MINTYISKQIYLNNIDMYYYYLENNNTYLYSINNSKKIKKNLYIIFLYNNNLIIKKFNIFKYILKKNFFFNYYYSLLENKELNSFNGSFYGFKSKIKIVGRGWKIVKSNYNTLLIKLGYSHPLFLTLSLHVRYKIKKKKKKYYVFNSSFFDKINTLTSKFNLMRVPDTYTRKGIFNRRYLL